MRSAALLVCTLVLLVPAAAQEKKDDSVLDCTDPGVLTAEGVKLDAPVKLLWARLVGDGSVDVAFTGASDRSIVFDYGGILSPSRFKVVYKCRFTSNTFERLEHKVFTKDSKEAAAIVKFLRDWAAKNLPDEKRAKLRDLPGGIGGQEYDKLSEEDQHLFGLVAMIDLVDKDWPAGKVK